MKKFWKYFGRTMFCIFTIICLCLCLIVGTILTLDYGPSVTARNLFVNSAMESSAGKFLATTFLGKSKVQEIQAMNTVEQTTEITDISMIEIPSQTDAPVQQDDEEPKDIEIIEVKGQSFNAHVALVHDPSRVSVGTCGAFGPKYSGRTVKDMADAAGATLAVNGGGFEDINGVGNGGTPIGIVIQDGKLVWGELDETYEVIGFDQNNILVVGYMTGQEALNRGMKSALSFGPILVVNGQPTLVTGEGSGVNPRTAIGQAADGTVILVVADGRQPNSIGATMADMIKILLDYGAVNGANLDGGSSSLMYYEGEYINQYTSMYGPRAIATCILVE